jgi:ABC-type glycerol-3-phosphate transport system substrate-binding protein
MDTKQKKLVILLTSIVVVLLILTVVAILILNSKKDDGGNETPTTEVELIYWGLWEPVEVMQPIIDKYEDENPGVKILYSQQAF